MKALYYVGIERVKVIVAPQGFRAEGEIPGGTLRLVTRAYVKESTCS